MVILVYSSPCRPWCCLGVDANETWSLGGGCITRETSRSSGPSRNISEAHDQPGVQEGSASARAAPGVNCATCVAGGRSVAVVVAVAAATVAPVPDPGQLLGPYSLLIFFASPTILGTPRCSRT